MEINIIITFANNKITIITFNTIQHKIWAPSQLFASYFALHYHLDDKIIGMIAALGRMAFRSSCTFDNCLIACGTHYGKDRPKI